MFWNRKDEKETTLMVNAIKSRVSLIEACHEQIEDGHKQSKQQLEVLKKQFKDLEEFVLTSISRANNAIEEQSRRLEVIESNKQNKKDITASYVPLSSLRGEEKYKGLRGMNKHEIMNELAVNKEKYFDLEEAAQFFECSKNNIRQACLRGRIPHIVVRLQLMKWKDSARYTIREYRFFDKNQMSISRAIFMDTPDHTYSAEVLPFKKNIMINK